jgi:hypothetical protein
MVSKELRSAQEAFQANEQELRRARDEFENKLTKRTAELRRSEKERRDLLDSIPAIEWSKEEKRNSAMSGAAGGLLKYYQREAA